MAMKLKKIVVYRRVDTKPNEVVTYIPSGEEGDYLCVYENDHGTIKASPISDDVAADLHVAKAGADAE
jgi:hypothetical protein